MNEEENEERANTETWRTLMKGDEVYEEQQQMRRSKRKRKRKRRRWE